MTTEAAIVRRILDYLNGLPDCKAIKIHGSQYAESGTPDIFCCIQGRCLLFEVKTLSGKATKIQQHRIDEWRAAGAEAWIVSSMFEVLDALEIMAF